MENITLDFANVLWTVKKILDIIERASFTFEIFIMAATALIIVLTIFLAIKIFRLIWNGVKPAFKKLPGIFTSIPKNIINFIVNRRKNGSTKRHLK